MSTTAGTTGTISDPSAVAELLRGRCALCGRAHSGFGHDARVGIWLAACGCGAIYQYRDSATAPASIPWYRTQPRP